MKHDYQKRLLVQALAKKGWTPSEIAAEVGVNRPFVYRWQQREDGGRHAGSGRLPKLDKKTLNKIHRKLHSEHGHSQRSIAGQMGLSQPTVSRAAKKLGLKP